MCGEHLDHLLVVLREPRRTNLVRQAEVTDDLITHAYRYAEEARHGRMVRRETDAARVAGDVRDAQRLAEADQHAEQPVAARQWPNPGALRGRKARGNEVSQIALRAHDPERPVTRTGKAGRDLHDA